MKGFVPGYGLEAPESLQGALDRLADGWRPLAGGTDVMVALEQGRLECRRWVGLWRIGELKGISELGDGTLSIGALTTYTELRESRVIARRFALLAQSAAVTGGIANQNRGTLGGNIGNASPAGDSLPVLLVYDAELELVSPAGRRRVPYERFHLGYKQVELRPDELIARILLPPGKEQWRQGFRKVAARGAQAISKVTIACAARMEQGRVADFRLAYGAVAPTPLRCRATEAALLGLGAGSMPESLPDETSPIDDLRSSAAYRRRVARNLLLRFLAELG